MAGAPLGLHFPIPPSAELKSSVTGFLDGHELGGIIKAITITQPWATLVAIGAKKIETRSWSTRYRGPLAIHAAKGLGSVGGMRGLKKLC